MHAISKYMRDRTHVRGIDRKMRQSKNNVSLHGAPENDKQEHG
jgi:hypothetical protein